MNLVLLNSSILNWSTPIPYLLLAFFLVLVFTVKVVTEAREAMKQVGSELVINPFGEYDSALKWASQHQKAVGIIMGIIVLCGLLCAINF